VTPATTTLLDDLALAHELADAADTITLDRFGAVDLRVERKPDLTPVSDADLAVEREVRRLLAERRPDDAVLGEEDGVTGDGPRQWVVDPVDGTKSFVRGVPVWATLVALRVQGRVDVGVVSAPALGRRWWAARGAGAYARVGDWERRLRVSAVRDLADASLSFSSLSGWEERGRLGGLLALTRSCWRTRAYGDFWSHVLVAEGAVDVSCEPEVSLWDLAPLQVLVEEAGGRFTDLSGAARADGGSVVCTNGALHDPVLALLSGSPSTPGERGEPERRTAPNGG
jgi:histidinol-phosphatase